jgi:predicted acyltransferase (DUF342 family)
MFRGHLVWGKMFMGRLVGGRLVKASDLDVHDECDVRDGFVDCTWLR